MKTLREILFARHQSATPKLDAIRQEIVAELNHQGTKALSEKIDLLSRCLGGLEKFWNELILPSRRIWAGLAAVWVLIIAANFSMRDHPTTTTVKSPSPEMISTFQQQEQLLSELIGPDEPSVAEPQKNYVPRPASERQFELMTV